MVLFFFFFFLNKKHYYSLAWKQMRYQQGCLSRHLSREHAYTFPECSGCDGHIPEESGHGDVCKAMLQLLSMYAGLLGPCDLPTYKITWWNPISKVLCSSSFSAFSLILLGELATTQAAADAKDLKNCRRKKKLEIDQILSIFLPFFL